MIHGRRTTAKAFTKDVFFNQERKLEDRRRLDTVVVSTINDADSRFARDHVAWGGETRPMRPRRGENRKRNQSFWAPGRVWSQD